MLLGEWRKKEGKSQQWVADRLNELIAAAGALDEATITQGTVQRWETGAIPRQENIRRVYKLTAGAVDFKDWYGGDEKPKRKSRATAVSVAASRKGAATLRKQREGRA